MYTYLDVHIKNLEFIKIFFCRNANVNGRWRNVWHGNAKKINAVLQKSVPA